jgi:hypothetical protein
VRPLTERDLEVLETLVYMRYESGARDLYEGDTAPLDFGGSNRSHHGKTASKLVDHGFVEHRRLGMSEWHQENRHFGRGGNRGSKVYRATETGREAIMAHRKLKQGFTSAGTERKWGHTIPATRRLTDAEKYELRLKCHLEMPK